MAQELTRSAVTTLAERGVPGETVYVADQDRERRSVLRKALRRRSTLANHPTADGWRLKASHTPLFLTSEGALHSLQSHLSRSDSVLPAPVQYISPRPITLFELEDGEPGFRVTSRGRMDTYVLESWLIREVVRLIRS